MCVCVCVCVRARVCVCVCVCVGACVCVCVGRFRQSTLTSRSTYPLAGFIRQLWSYDHNKSVTGFQPFIKETGGLIHSKSAKWLDQLLVDHPQGTTQQVLSRCNGHAAP